MKDNSETLRATLAEVGKTMQSGGLTWGITGNLSARLGKDTFLISATGACLGELRKDDFVETGLDGSTTGPRRPSKETQMHRAVYQERPDIGAVLHASPFYATLLACTDLPLPPDLFVEDMYYLERVERVGYFHPGSMDLAEAVRARARSANILLLANHGVLVYDNTIQEALMGLHTLEMACRLLVTARSAQIDLKRLPEAVVADFLNHSGYRPRREWVV